MACVRIATVVIIFYFISLMFTTDVFCATGMDPIVKITETDPPSEGLRVKGHLTQDVVLNCFVENRPTDTQVRWQRTMFDKTGRASTTEISTDLSVEDNMKWSIEKPTSLSWRLRIKSLVLYDEGNYTCYVLVTDNLNRREANRTVFAYAKPVVLEGYSSNDMTQVEGADFIMRCNATGRPTPTILWRRQGNAILPGGGVTYVGSELVIKDVQYDAAGLYICEALNEMGRDRRDIQLSILYAPKLTPKESSLGQAIGYQRTLTCYIEANPQPKNEQIFWKKDNQIIKDSDRMVNRLLEGAYGKLTMELLIYQVQAEDYGIYICSASNDMEASSNVGSAQIELIETAEPQADKRGVVSKSHHLLPLYWIQFILALVICTCLL